MVTLSYSLDVLMLLLVVRKKLKVQWEIVLIGLSKDHYSTESSKRKKTMQKLLFYPVVLWIGLHRKFLFYLGLWI